MNLSVMLDMLHDRTKKYNDDPLLIRELNAALDYVWQRIYTVFPDVEVTFETTGTLSADTQQFDLASEIEAVGGTFYGSKTFWIKGANDDRYIPVVFVKDVNAPEFLAQDQETAEVLQPVMACMVNFGEIRFAPPLPSGTLWRSDWIGKPPNLSLGTNVQTSIPEPLHQAMTDYATATVFGILDDTREQSWMYRAEGKILSAIHVIKRRQFQTPQGTTPYPPRGGQGWAWRA